ncbi:Emopamil-binding protein [Basidiobolus meristosporus CBS 931.73]|uniref:Emopamil-binding protein n=1 Tax=Basidiobolus meristosporus CBS 931.73 TaxID=1314790 RepID=A0A1Y1WRP9_9FUNG|nr:Emopamil-binding protein [Basidiobolus meristosporus CBS 931.73]|eukprot:ORX76142.1 Emopamil-binding protein [Basidiobolus meristosporus CBS 931.73]
MNTVNSHPYYPRNLSLPHYVPNTSGTGHILSVTQDRLLFMWCVLAGLIHVGLEGYYIQNYASLAGDQFVLGQVWKEYSKGDSRYLSSDPFVLNMERITAVRSIGLIVLVTLHSVFNQTPGRHLGLLSVSICQLYGDVLYFATTFFEGSPHSDPHPLYYWFYFVTMNGIWIVIPSYLLVRSWMAIIRACSAAHVEKNEALLTLQNTPNTAATLTQ